MVRARKENTDPKSSTDEQRRRIAKGLQPLAAGPVRPPGFVAPRSQQEHCGYETWSRRAPVTQTGPARTAPIQEMGSSSLRFVPSMILCAKQ